MTADGEPATTYNQPPPPPPPSPTSYSGNESVNGSGTASSPNSYTAPGAMSTSGGSSSGASVNTDDLKTFVSKLQQFLQPLQSVHSDLVSTGGPNSSNYGLAAGGMNFTQANQMRSAVTGANGGGGLMSQTAQAVQNAHDGISAYIDAFNDIIQKYGSANDATKVTSQDFLNAVNDADEGYFSQGGGGSSGGSSSGGSSSGGSSSGGSSSGGSSSGSGGS